MRTKKKRSRNILKEHLIRENTYVSFFMKNNCFFFSYMPISRMRVRDESLYNQP